MKVKRSPDYRSLGDIDEKGTWLAEVIDGYLPSLRASTDDDLRLLTCKKSELEDDQLFAVMRNGERGVAADLIGEGGAVEFRQHPRHLHDMKTGILLRLPPSEDLGWLCIHLNNRRGAKALLCNELIANFREDFPQLMLEINPCVAGAALQEAIDRGAIQKLKLVRFDHPDDSANRAASGKWVDRNVTARIELDVSGVLRSTGRVLGGSRINPNLIRRFFRGDRSTFGQIVEFQGITFDEARIEVELADGSVRTFNIESPQSGHPITEALEGLQLREGDPTDQSLKRAMIAALDSATS